ncbi:hypothetical protein D9756_011316 [Leucocoprinus leucothites]|uniref:Uncharacterized protein n=1 Tax=Leucocoprinus leucothites TaxID=201217 RepID=A0A8H5CNX1_9AGAR|nr:hypothetical protein D9756_011316 [Leucoagaricus leucothites]
MVELIKQVEDLIQKLDSNLSMIAGVPWEISSPYKDHWIVIDKFMQAGFEVCVAFLLMSRRIVEYFSSPGRAISEDNPRSTSDIGVIDDMMSMATAFNSALLELHEDDTTLADISDSPLIQAGFYRDSIRSSCPLETATSLVNAVCSLDESWRLALLPGNSDVLDSAREELVNVFREHTIRVRVSANDLWEYSQGAERSSSNPNDNFLKNLWHGDEAYLPDAQHAVDLLESYLNNPPWNFFYRLVDCLLGADAIYGLNHIQSSSLTVLIHDTPCKINTVASNYLRLLEQMRVAFSSTLVIEKGLRCIQTAGCYQLLQDPALTLSFMTQEQETIRSATHEARATVDSLLSFLKELQQCPDIKCQGDNSDTVQDDIPCTKCIINTLYDHFESILRDVLGEKRLSWVKFKSTRTGMANLFPVVKKLVDEPRNDRIDVFEELLDELFPPVAISQPSSSESPAPNTTRDFQDQVTVWSCLVSRAHEPISIQRRTASSSRKVWQWRPCKAKKQAEFARDSRESRMRFEREKNGLKVDAASSVTGFVQAGARGHKGIGGDQLDWTF